MKKFKLFSSAFVAALLLASCSANDDVINNGGSASNESQYVTVNITSVGTSGTRADNEDYDPANGNNKDYVDGTEAESKINKVRFYFFDANGNAFVLNNGGATGTSTNVSWVEKEVTKDNNDHTTTVETKTTAILLIDGQTGQKPAKLIAVVNPDAVEENVLGDTPTESQLKEALLGNTNNCNTEKGGFVMTNSTYLKDGAEVCATDISTQTYETQTEAEANPVDIYVERVNVKVVASAENSDAENPKWEDVTINNESYKACKVAKYGEQDVYAVVKGWGLADEDGQSYMNKKVETSWSDTSLGITPWNTADYHRSFWATSVPFGDTNSVKNHAYNTFTTAFGEALYTQENTPTETPNADALYTKANTLTKVLVAATLMTKDSEGNWKEFEYATYAGETFNGGEESVLKKAAALYGTEYYKLSTDGNTNTWTSLTENDFQIASHNGTYVQVGLNLAEGVKLYKKNDTNAISDNDLKAFDNKIQSQYTAQIAKDGATYYFAPIEHLATDANSLGHYGVVRNHVYRIAITSLAGYGTPVVEPDSDNETIDPEIPEDSKTYLAARMNALSWRIVKNSIDMDKTKK